MLYRNMDYNTIIYVNFKNRETWNPVTCIIIHLENKNNIYLKQNVYYIAS